MKECFKNHNKKKRIIEKYNSSSYFYDDRYRVIQEKKYEIVLKNYSPRRKIILDLGCGTGLLHEYVVKSISKKEEIKSNYVGVDISWKMLLKFKSKYICSNNLKYLPNIILTDIEHLPFRDNIFSSIFSLTSFQNLPNIKRGIAESHRVSKNNANFKCSILKKKIELKSLLKILKPDFKDLEIIQEDKLEDFIIQGKISKD